RQIQQLMIAAADDGDDGTGGYRAPHDLAEPRDQTGVVVVSPRSRLDRLALHRLALTRAVRRWRHIIGSSWRRAPPLRPPRMPPRRRQPCSDLHIPVRHWRLAGARTADPEPATGR